MEEICFWTDTFLEYDIKQFKCWAVNEMHNMGQYYLKNGELLGLTQINCLLWNNTKEYLIV